MFRFEKLDVWQKAIVFADTVCATTSTFPTAEPEMILWILDPRLWTHT